MKVIAPSHEILLMPAPEDILALIETAGRTCYKSEHLVSHDSAPKFISRIVASGHHSVIEHAGVSVRFICDRGVTHELVRHRLAAYSQESTRYANYSQERFGRQITVIRPLFWPRSSPQYQAWLAAMAAAEKAYLELLELGARPEQARSVLPNSLKTEIVMSANLREWRHVFTLRCSKAAHPQIREITLPLLEEMHQRVPVLFDDLWENYAGDLAKLRDQIAAWDQD